MEPDESNEFEELMKDDSLTQESLNEKLQQYRAAVEQEFESSVKSDPDNLTEHMHEFFKNNTAQAAAQIVWLAHNAESESVRKDLLKYIVDRGLEDAKKDGDPIMEALGKLQKQKDTSDT